MNIDLKVLDDVAENSGSAPAVSDAFGQGRKIKNTSSICPQCLEPIDAEVFERQGEVWMDKTCARHGQFSALLSSDIRHYFEPGARSGASPSSGASCCGSSCGLATSDVLPGANTTPWTNHSCTILIEIIERCNLSCPTCFAGSSPLHSKVMSLEEFTRQVDQLVTEGKRDSDMIQLSGGEPTIHPSLFAMVDLLFERGFHKVCINSNGIKLAQPSFTERLANCMNQHPRDQIFVYLQFDGFEDNTYARLRGREDLLQIKRRALDNCQAHGIRVHPVMTLTRDINDHEVGDFVRLAVENPALKNVVIQPAMYSGRYDNPQRQDRLTLADTVTLICDQFGVFSPEDFVPIPCSDPNCFGMAVAIRTDNGLLPVSRYFPRYESWDSDEARELIDRLSNTIDGPQAISEAIRWASTGERVQPLLQGLDNADVDCLLDALIEHQTGAVDIWDKLLTISIKPFMDAWTYDQDRIDRCCVHVLDQDGKPVSFCEFNAITRPRLARAKAISA